MQEDILIGKKAVFFQLFLAMHGVCGLYIVFPVKDLFLLFGTRTTTFHSTLSINKFEFEWQHIFVAAHLFVAIAAT